VPAGSIHDDARVVGMDSGGIHDTGSELGSGFGGYEFGGCHSLVLAGRERGFDENLNDLGEADKAEKLFDITALLVVALRSGAWSIGTTALQAATCSAVCASPDNTAYFASMVSPSNSGRSASQRSRVSTVPSLFASR